MERRTRRTARAAWLVGVAAAAAAGVGCQSLSVTDRSPHSGAPWTTRLPACPCRQPQPDAVGDGWALDRDSSLRQHPGSAACFRSYPPVRTDVGRSGQQCCYDLSGALVTSGSAAGTPDRATSCRGERTDGRMKVRLLGFVSHVVKDVRPWARRLRSWRTYHTEWPPDNSNACRMLHVEVQQGGAMFVWWEEPNQTAWSSDRMRRAGYDTGDDSSFELAHQEGAEKARGAS